ncbi:hypothetical protein Golob_005208, partial [Gossypium lobatum]|nr:hypothetical protein [Gossypium lobatum]
MFEHVSSLKSKYNVFYHYTQYLNLRDDVLLELYTNLGLRYNLSAFGNPLDVDGIMDGSTKSILGDVPWLLKWCLWSEARMFEL